MESFQVESTGPFKPKFAQVFDAVAVRSQVEEVDQRLFRSRKQCHLVSCDFHLPEPEEKGDGNMSELETSYGRRKLFRTAGCDAGNGMRDKYLEVSPNSD